MNVAEQLVEALLESDDRIVESGLDRRSFLKMFGAGLAALGLTPTLAVQSAQAVSRKGGGGFFFMDFTPDGVAIISKDGVTWVTADTGKPVRHREWQRPVRVSIPAYGRNERELPRQTMESIAVDLDGTLAKDSGWKGPEHIGEPVKPMLDLVRKLLDDGEEVVIFTARVHDGEKSTKEHIAQWLKDHDLPDLEITNEKRPDMEKFYDDKAVAVEKNTGDLKSGA